MMLILSWDQFDQAVIDIAHRAARLKPVGVYGIPRGGTVLAVAISHRMEVPLLYDPMAGGLIVDDILETGATIAKAMQRLMAPDPNLIFFWVNKSDQQANCVLNVSESKPWVVFPWEPTQNAENDKRAYYAANK